MFDRLIRTTTGRSLLSTTGNHSLLGYIVFIIVELPQLFTVSVFDVRSRFALFTVFGHHVG